MKAESAAYWGFGGQSDEEKDAQVRRSALRLLDMNTQNYKRTMQIIFAELANGNGQPFVDAMHDDFAWTISGQGPWARTWRGRNAVRTELFGRLFAQFAIRYRNTAKNFIAEGDTVVVECKGDVATKQGNRYDNDYCYRL